MPVVICELAHGESICSESGAMSWMSPNMQMETLGGGIGGRLFARVSAAWLRWIFALFLLYGAWRYLT